MSLKDRLKAQIAATGPMSVAQYMTACLHDPEDGYYATRPRLGAGGDFITAPMVSQMFGELIGLWSAEVWAALGRPEHVRLVEVGPGDGTLMADALRAARAAPGFLEAAEVWLVEVSAPLKTLQAEKLAGTRSRWIGGLGELPAGPPVILVANEVIDCLPARQFVSTEDGWAERVIGLDHCGELAFGLRAVGPNLLPLREKVAAERPDEGSKGLAAEGAATPGPDGSRGPLSPLLRRDPLPQGERIEHRAGVVWESSAAQAAFGADVAHIVRRDTGAALLIDYGRSEPGFGDTLQALTRHRKVDPLECPGEADLTIHADFPAVLAAAREAGAATTAIVSQAEFLRRLGIAERAAALARSRPDKAESLSRQLERLTGPEEMGHLFKAAAIRWPADLALPAFEEA